VAKLRRLTKLLPVKRNDTRWSPIYMLIKRYFEIIEYVDIRDRYLKDYYEKETLKAFEGILGF